MPEQKLTARQQGLQMLKFTLFSLSAGLIQIGSFTLLEQLTPLRYWPCYLIALVLSVLWNFTFNRRFTFQSAANIPKAMTQVFLYYLAFTPLSIWGGDALTQLGWNEYLVLGLTMLVNFVTEYLFQRFVVFRGSINSRKA